MTISILSRKETFSIRDIRNEFQTELQSEQLTDSEPSAWNMIRPSSEAVSTFSEVVFWLVLPLKVWNAR